MALGKTLAIQFKYLGDAVILTPALKALKAQRPDSELHVLVAAEIAPLLENISWITKVWAMPRVRGKARLLQSLPFIRALRKEGFERCVDFGGNDRGALLSLLSGAPARLGPIEGDKPRLVHKVCYTQMARPDPAEVSWFDVYFRILSAWGIGRPASPALEIACSRNHADAAAKILPADAIICHIATSQPKKDWPITHWRELYLLAQQAGLTLAFSSGNSARERKLMEDFRTLVPEARVLPPMTDLDLFLNVLKLSRLVIAGDTGPLHFAAGLGVPVLGLFGTGDSRHRTGPIYDSNQIINASQCLCDAEQPNPDYCRQALSCMASITPSAVFERIRQLLPPDKNRTLASAAPGRA